MFVTLHIMLATSIGKAMALLLVCLAWAVALQWYVYKRCRLSGSELTDDESKSLDPFDIITLHHGPDASATHWATSACRALAHDGYIAIDKQGTIRVHDTPKVPITDEGEHAYRGVIPPEKPSHPTLDLVLGWLRGLKTPSLSAHNIMLITRQLQPALAESISRLEDRGLLLSGAARTRATTLALVPFVAGFGVALYIFINLEVRVIPGAIVPSWFDVILLVLVFFAVGIRVLARARARFFRTRSADDIDKHMLRTCRAWERAFSHPEAGRPSGEELIRAMTVYPNNTAVQKAAGLG